MNSFVLFSTLAILIVILGTGSAQTLPPRRFLTKKYETIHGRRMAYVEVGKGDPIVFLHGNPTSSFLWRNIMPHLEKQGRLIAPDLIGMGDSEKLPPGDPSRYTVLQHANFLFTLFEKLGVKTRVTFVIHDWGSALGFLWAYRNRYNPNTVKGIAFMESIVAPYLSGEFTDRDILSFFETVRSPLGEKLILQDNIFIEQTLPGAIIRNLTTKEMDEYRRPFLNPGEDRRPLLTFPRQVPIDGVPASTVSFISAYSNWMSIAPFPKLLISANPGLIMTGSKLELARTWPNLEEISVNGIHFVQEDSPDEIGEGISNWLQRINENM